MPINKFVARKTDKTRLWGYRYLKFTKAVFFFFYMRLLFSGPLCVLCLTHHMWPKLQNPPTQNH